MKLHMTMELQNLILMVMEEIIKVLVEARDHLLNKRLMVHKLGNVLDIHLMFMGRGLRKNNINREL